MGKDLRAWRGGGIALVEGAKAGIKFNSDTRRSRRRSNKDAGEEHSHAPTRCHRGASRVVHHPAAECRSGHRARQSDAGVRSEMERRPVPVERAAKGTPIRSEET